MIRNFISRYFLVLTVVAACAPYASVAQKRTDTAGIVVPLGGNAWLSPNATAEIDEHGLSNWTDNKDVITIYIRPENKGSMHILFKTRVPDGESKISLSALGQTLTRTIKTTGYQFVSFGEIKTNGPGYIKLQLRGLSKTGKVFADIDYMTIIGTAVKDSVAFVKDNHGNYFYWGRRGPSVHLNYTVPAEAKNTTEWFYNEVTVPMGQDVQGSYFMADGFSGGYFGMQVNSPDTRHILFSVWSPYTTDDPKTIPDHLKIKLLKKGANVHGGEFGG